MVYKIGGSPDIGSVGSSYGIGRLSHIYDQSGVTSFIYDHRGNVLEKWVSIDEQNFITRYSYTLADQLKSIQYPSGRLVEYQFDSDGRINGVTQNTLAVVSNISYKPFGPVAAYDFANGISRSLQYDLDYRLTDMVDMGTVSKLDLDYGYDLNSNINDWDDALDASNDQAFSYDELNRLDTASGNYGNVNYDYDDVGNRTQKVHTENSTTLTQTYHYPVNGNRLTQVDSDDGTTQSNRQFIYDNAGNTVKDTRNDGTVLDLNYNATQRFNVLKVNNVEQAWYQHNALGQRVRKSTLSESVYYHYDERGQLLALSDASGQVIKEYIYAGAMRVARLVHTSGNTSIEYLHNDHLGRPLALSDASQAIVWQAHYLPFGEVRVVINTTADQELGFPGQVLDSESGFWYNYFRDYDAGLGRYIQSDPIGLLSDYSNPQLHLAQLEEILQASVDTPLEINDLYRYVKQNPLLYIDPFGLRNVGNGRRANGSRSNSKNCRSPRDKCILDFTIAGHFATLGAGAALKAGSLIGQITADLGTVVTFPGVAICYNLSDESPCDECDK